MKKSELKQLIKEVIDEVQKTTGYVVVDLDRELGAFNANEKFGGSPINPNTGDVDGQWEHILDKDGNEIGWRQDWETNFSIFPDRNSAVAWATKYLRNVKNPATGNSFRYQIYSYGEWERNLNRNIKSIGK